MNTEQIIMWKKDALAYLKVAPEQANVNRLIVFRTACMLATTQGRRRHPHRLSFCSGP